MWVFCSCTCSLVAFVSGETWDRLLRLSLICDGLHYNSFVNHFGPLLLCFKHISQTWPSNRPGGLALCSSSTSFPLFVQDCSEDILVQHVDLSLVRKWVRVWTIFLRFLCMPAHYKENKQRVWFSIVRQTTWKWQIKNQSLLFDAVMKRFPLYAECMILDFCRCGRYLIQMSIWMCKYSSDPELQPLDTLKFKKWWWTNKKTSAGTAWNPTNLFVHMANIFEQIYQLKIPAEIFISADIIEQLCKLISTDTNIISIRLGSNRYLKTVLL